VPLPRWEVALMPNIAAAGTLVSQPWRRCEELKTMADSNKLPGYEGVRNFLLPITAGPPLRYKRGAVRFPANGGVGSF
jgi:hypothetical protein